jgi:uncharacterized protein (TIGR03083 family)
MIHAERAALAADLEGLPDEQWATPSLCEGWTVQEVLGHMTATAKSTPARFFRGLTAAGFKFNAMTAKDAAAEAEGTPAETLAHFKAQLNATTHPPGPVDAMLGEAVIHSADIRRPLGISRSYPEEELTRVGDFYKRSNLIVGTKRRIAGLKVHATDADWSTGAGAEVSGPMLSLLLAMTGRKAVVDDLSGEGLSILQARL